jgi:single-strand DNA-binding protein
VDCVVWTRTAEVLKEHAGKGSPLLIEGRLDLESWLDKETKEKRSKLVVVVEGFQFLNSAPKGDSNAK